MTLGWDGMGGLAGSEKEWEEVGDGDILETTQCLLSVCLISDAHLGPEKDLIVQMSHEAFLSGAAQGQSEAWTRCGAPRGSNLSRSLL